MESLRITAAQYLQECKANLASLTVVQAEFYATKATELFFAYYEANAQSLREAVEILCVLNTAPQPEISRVGLQALFPNLIEKLNDSFRPEFCALYDQVFAQVIQFCRQQPEAKNLHESLNAFTLPDEAALLARRVQLNSAKIFLSATRPLKKILLLSRVTIGADVAITSVLMAQLLAQFPSAEIVLLGSEKLHELYGGEKRIRIRPIQYGRGGRLIERLLTWIDVVAAVNAEIAGLQAEEFCVFDPDSRLTQLGLLPLLPANQEVQSYFYFPSRSFQRTGKTKIGELAAAWCNEICQTEIRHYPFLALPDQIKNIGQEIGAKLRQHSTLPIVALSFGTGGNLSKRVNEDFEIRVAMLLAESATIILDNGLSEFERSQVQKITSVFSSNGKKIVQLNETNFSAISVSDNWSNRVLTWQGGIGSFASIIEASDCYVGYDSSGQHFAAAAGTPLITIFVNSGSEIFAERWKPTGSGKQKFALVEPANCSFNSENVSVLIQKILKFYQQVLQ